MGLLHIIALHGDPGEGADAVFSAWGGEEGEAGFAFGGTDFDPALAGAHGLIGQKREAEFGRVEVEGAVLIADGDADEFEFANHGVSFS